MDHRIERIACKILIQEVLQAMTAKKLLAVINNGKTCVEKGVVAQHGHNVLFPELIVAEKCSIGGKAYLSALRFITRHNFAIIQNLSPLKLYTFGLTFSTRLNGKRG